MIFSDYIVFVDESGDHGLTHVNLDFPLFVLSFCIFKKIDYINLAIPKLASLKFATFGHSEVIFHEADIRKKTGDFHKLGKEERESFLQELTTIIEELPFTLIAVVIRKDKLNSQYYSPHNPYNIAMKYGLERVYQFLETEHQELNHTHLLFECRGKKEDAELELEFRRVCDGENVRSKSFPFHIKFVDKKSNSTGLQLADMTARPIGLKIHRRGVPNRAVEVLERKFFRHTYWPGNSIATEWGFGIKVFP